MQQLPAASNTLANGEGLCGMRVGEGRSSIGGSSCPSFGRMSTESMTGRSEVSSGEGGPLSTTHASTEQRGSIDYGWLYFTLEPNTPLTLPCDKVVGISMHINGGNYEIGPSDLSISIRGSNAYTYWVSSDNSVQLSDKISFSETRLYYLEITRAIPRNTWVEVIIYPSKLMYDPNYLYITGFYLKNDKGMYQTIYIDNVTLLLLK